MARLRQDLYTCIEGAGIVPVVRIEHPEHAVPLARALSAGGIPVAEITFRTDAALRSIETIAQQEPDLLLGAGTVLSATQAGEAVQAGAQFIVSPGFNPAVVEYCIRNEVPVLPGINSPTQIEQAIEMGLRYLKFFPAEASGGLEMLKAMAAPYGGIRFVPTGGISVGNLRSYLDFSRVLACGGSWLSPPDLMARGDFGAVTALAREAVATILDFRIAGIRFEEPDAVSRAAAADLFSLFNSFSRSPGMSLSWEAGTDADRGTLVVETADLERAIHHLTGRGIRPAATSAEKVGAPVRLDKSIGGFAVELAARARRV